ncbi:MAG TPA: GNAT family N-acetyltransferase [Capillimicrobium sp.]|nr:GNAT family N-acetyltransferase [Capillimicrobium sp.]
MDVRPMRPGDVRPLAALTRDAWGQPGEDRATEVALATPRIAHLLGTDPGGAWTAVDADGAVAGGALALVRDGVWGLSLLIVREDVRSGGVGRRLLEAALTHADGARGGIILSSTDPRAMRRYARAGFALRPCVAACGIVARDRLRPPDGVREGSLDDVPETVAASRHVRGARHDVDLPTMLSHPRRRLLVHEHGFAVHQEGSPQLLAATGEAAARELLWACFAASRPGATVTAEFVTAGQDWAIEVALEAGLALSPDGPVFVRGDVGPMAPYLPSGAYL